MVMKLSELRGEIAEFCRRHHIQKLALFGSVLRNDFQADSDVDVLVEFVEGRTPDFFHLHEMEQELSEIFAGHEIDLVTFSALNKHLREQVLSTAAIQYEQR